jgi:UDP-N-acetylmuramoyl-tripeptide--D-alanyl-D-alanine ligase
MGKPVWFVMGDMGEMGADAAVLHAEIGAYAKQKQVQKMWTLGEHSAKASVAFGANGQHFNDIEDLIEHIKQGLSAELVVLVKGSRFMKMERVVEALMPHQAEMATPKGKVCY